MCIAKLPLASIAWASLQTGVGQSARAAALVQLETDEGASVVYTVLTMKKPTSLGNIIEKRRS